MGEGDPVGRETEVCSGRLDQALAEKLGEFEDARLELAILPAVPISEG